MTFLLDTNVLSEGAKPGPDPNVAAWFSQTDEDRLFLSVASLAEIRRGIELLPTGRRREQFAGWLADDLPARFAGRILDIDRSVGETWGLVMARAQRAGLTLDAMDGFFAATAEAHELILVTRNVRHFAATGVTVFDPWNQGR